METSTSNFERLFLSKKWYNFKILICDEKADLREMCYKEIMVNVKVFKEKMDFSILKYLFQIYVILNFSLKMSFWN